MKSEVFKNWTESQEGKDAIEKTTNSLIAKEKIKEAQLERLHNKGNFSEFVEKVIAKYNSDKYKNKWWNRNVMPPEDLYYFLADYAAKYGREATACEYKLFGGDFTSSLYYCEGYYFEILRGQGTFIVITKAKSKNIPIEISEIIELKKRINEINSYDLNNIDFIGKDNKKVNIDKFLINEFKYTGLSNIDFIISEFYKTGFEEK